MRVRPLQNWQHQQLQSLLFMYSYTWTQKCCQHKPINDDLKKHKHRSSNAYLNVHVLTVLTNLSLNCSQQYRYRHVFYISVFSIVLITSVCRCGWMGLRCSTSSDGVDKVSSQTAKSGIQEKGKTLMEWEVKLREVFAQENSMNLSNRGKKQQKKNCNMGFRREYRSV